MPPLVAVSADRRTLGPPPALSLRVRPPRPEVYLGEAVIRALRAAGAEPLLLPPHDGSPEAQQALTAAVLERVDGLVLTGGSFDIHPRHYGQQIAGRLDRVDDGRTGLELALARAAMARDLPLLGVCGGMQAMAVAAGGTLLQDIGAALPEALDHEQPTDPARPAHPVTLGLGPLRDAVETDELEVNSTHHQAVEHTGALVDSGWSPDGIIEVVHHPELRFCLGVQWHPELLEGDPVYGAFVRALGRP